MTDDIEAAIEAASEPDDEQAPEVPDVGEDEPEDDGGGGMLDGVIDMSGTGKSLDAYEESPYRSLAGGVGGDVDADELRDKGEKHVARGIDGLLGGLLDAGHPVVDLFVGFLLIMLAASSDGDGDILSREELAEKRNEEKVDPEDLPTTGDA